MAQAARYLFDLDFSAPPEPEVEEQIEEIPPEPMITVAEHERLLAEAKAQAFAEGESKAREERDQLASEQNLALEKQIIEEISMVYTEVGLLMQRLERDASNLAFAFASRFAERLVAQEPKGEIMGLLNQILAPLRKTPHISIRLNDAVADDIKVAVDEQMAELGFTGKLTILPDPVVMPGDCEVEWVDGGIGRNLRAAVRQVEQLLEDHFSHVPEDAEQDEDEDDTPAEDATPSDTEETEEKSEASANAADAQDQETATAANPADSEQAGDPVSELAPNSQELTQPADAMSGSPAESTEAALDQKFMAPETDTDTGSDAAAPTAKGENE
ncbi:FliH/SctL family protein [uncultured Cohaesibacter sp.]|uniref:FliH/SctL family protein n=1 Tax=uncultured Cohaesibacter sp. TaxID=1002546 RepID=UPI002AABB47E|nr:FliH/SctL family protein [uncultured Cohaesibacter sp.]